jgi:aspartate aminotransferase
MLLNITLRSAAGPQGMRAFSRSIARCKSTGSPWAAYDMAPLDPIIGLNEQFQRDDDPQKVIVGVGAYRDNLGKPFVLPCVREAEQKMMDGNLDMEYSGIVSLLANLNCTFLFL